MTNVDEQGYCLECGEPVCEECNLHISECRWYDEHYAENEGVERPVR